MTYVIGSFARRKKAEKQQIFKDFKETLTDERKKIYGDEHGASYVTLGLTQLLDTSLSDSDKVLLMLLRAYSSLSNEGGGYCYPTEKTLAKQLNKTDRSVRNGLRNLCKKGFIQKIADSDNRMGNVYAVGNFASGPYSKIPEQIREQRGFYLGNPEVREGYHFQHIRGRSEQEIEEYFSSFTKRVSSIENNAIFHIPSTYNGQQVNDEQYVNMLCLSIKEMLTLGCSVKLFSQEIRPIAELFISSCNDFYGSISKMFGKITMNEVKNIANQLDGKDIIEHVSLERSGAFCAVGRKFSSRGGWKFFSAIIKYKIISILFENILKEKYIKENFEAFGLSYTELLNLLKNLYGLVNKKILLNEKVREETTKREPSAKTSQEVLKQASKTGKTPLPPLTLTQGVDMNKQELFNKIKQESFEKSRDEHQKRIERKNTKLSKVYAREEERVEKSSVVDVQTEINCIKSEAPCLAQKVFGGARKNQLDAVEAVNVQIAGNMEGMPQNTHTLFMEYKILLKKHFGYESNMVAGKKELGQLKNILGTYQYHAYLELMIKTFEYWDILKSEFFFLKDSEMPTLSVLCMSERMEKIEMLVHKIESGKYEKKEKGSKKKGFSASKKKKVVKKASSENKKKKVPVAYYKQLIAKNPKNADKYEPVDF